MLEYIKLQNFQAWKDKTITFHEGSNSIVGPNDVGKSAIRRAFELVAFNSPSGESYRHWDGGDTLVEIGWNGHVIRRIRTDKINSYELDDLKAFTGFGTKVPIPIQEVLGLHRDINVLGQHDGAFLVGDKGTSVAKFINELADISVIDTMLQYISKQIGVVTKEIKGLELRKDKLTESLSEFKGLDAICELAEKAIKQEGQLKELEQNTIEVEATILNIKKYSSKLESFKEKLTNIDEIESSIKLIDEIITEGAVIKDICDVVSCIIHSNEILEETNFSLEIYELIPVALEDLNSLMVMEDSITEIVESISTIEELTANRKTMRRELRELTEEFDKEMPDKCPLCEQEIKNG